MEKKTHLHFDAHVGKQKPESIVNRGTQCPFCDVDNLEGILAQEHDIILIKNKYPVLKNTVQTVLIETDDCNSELSQYSKAHLHQLIRFGINKWQEFSASGEFMSVLFYKNHGPMSGGTIHHPHMQIVGLKDVDYRDHVHTDHFIGLPIHESAGVSFNVSTQPRVGFFEFNVIMRDMSGLAVFSDYIQVAVDYVLHHFNAHCNSYNLFFYELNDDAIGAKIVPRFVTSPLFVGFSIPQVSDRIDDIVPEIQRRYFEH